MLTKVRKHQRIMFVMRKVIKVHKEWSEEERIIHFVSKLSECIE